MRQPLRFAISLAPELNNQIVSGRLLVFLSSQKKTDELAPQWGVDVHSVWIAADDISNLTAGQIYYLDADRLAYPNALSEAPPGNYQVMAVVDVVHHYVYNGLHSGDLRSRVVELKNFDPRRTSPVPILLSERVAETKNDLPDNAQLLDFVSPSLSAFWGRPIHMREVILLPPSYNKTRRRYPTVYWTHGFSGDLEKMLTKLGPGPYPRSIEENWARPLREGKLPEMIYVMLDQSCPGGTHEFADSVNNGPWAHALTTELIPYLESHFRMIRTARARFLNGHSSGGWAALWLQVRYPEVFGGSWPTAPDPSDFHDFTGPNLYEPAENYYRKPDGSAWMLVRIGGKDVQSLEDAARQERVLGDYGGQLSSFEWVFSPRGPDGRPQPLFERDTGAIDPAVAKYWCDHWDIAAYIRRNATRLRPLLNGKIHLIVGTEDTFHLDRPARLLEQAFKDSKIRAQFTYLPGRTHLDLYEGGLVEEIARQMDVSFRRTNTNTGRGQSH